MTRSKRQEAELRFSLGVMRMIRIRNEHIRGTEQGGRFGDKVRGQIEMVWMCAEEGQ